MDCEKFEPLLLDELYDELDELTSAAVKRHVASCAKCGSILSGFRSTRRAIDLPMVEVPTGLEDRILAAAREAQKVVPIKSRMGRALSVAERWAMRPQTAMAAVFLLMIGTSAFLIRSKNYGHKDANVSVTVEGSPTPTAVAQSNESLDDKAAAAAHGPSTSNVTHPPVVTATAAASAVAMNEPDNNGLVDRLTGGAAREKKKDEDPSGMIAALGDSNSNRDLAKPSVPMPAPTSAPLMNAGPAAGAPAPPPPAYAQQAVPPPMTKRAGGADDGAGADPFSLGSAAFRARNFAEAARQFDIAAQGGDMNAALWAAEATREGKGCAVALGRFVDVSNKAGASYTAHEASLKAARCQIAMGQLDPARDRLNKLAAASPPHVQQAKAALAELDQVAQRKGSGGPSAGGAAAAPKRAAPAAPRSPVRAPSAESEQQKKSLDKAGF